ncbi:MULTISPECIES: hypothetical protein [unclassified Paenibacillus]|uniref:Uncharacterized protein n=1 Tax=Paenibacillus provencensis TaxID=441151 RepID=A0ABW3QH39_9BACL|nr:MULTISPECIES: hypothetical protein [unclassified Paenibacillus]MCM3130203.1 hypothetical protein [Paenibacillus sp. MER 78]SDX71612.1 hypothetical protein SAMN05518848_11294 [Paenibacillus sp. PDC88]SFS88822.1 hypothetical protein SAMN04488601_10690 [Paenibacillus sp. 453mf]
MAKSFILTCSLCENFDSMKKKCKVNGVDRYAHDATYASECNSNGNFVRYMNVIPDVYNYYSENEDTPVDWAPDLKRIPTDKNDLPLIVKTKRGLERAIPADHSVELKVDTLIEGKVPAILTYQGQRELIYELGISISQSLADKAGVPLKVLPEEVGWEGIPELVGVYLGATKSYDRGGKAWLTNKPVKWKS